MGNETLGRCDKKQYEHCGAHPRYPEVGQRLPPFACVNWKPDPESVPRAVASGSGNENNPSAIPSSGLLNTDSLDADEPCPDPRCNALGAMPIPACVAAVAWAEEASKAVVALRAALAEGEVSTLLWLKSRGDIQENKDTLATVYSKDLMPLAFVRARDVLKDWPEIPCIPFSATQANDDCKTTTVPDHGQASSPESVSETELSSLREQNRAFAEAILSGAVDAGQGFDVVTVTVYRDVYDAALKSAKEQK